VSRSCRIERLTETTEINHEETKKTKKTKKGWKNLRALRFFVVDFRRSLNETNPALSLIVVILRNLIHYE
jgi:hypothetical protein